LTNYDNNETETIYDSDEHKNYQPKKDYSLEELIELDNVAEILDDDELEALGNKVKDEYDADKLTRADKEDQMIRSMKLAMLVSLRKNLPFPNSSDITYPMLTAATLQFAARALPAIVTPTGIVKAKRVGNDPEGQKARVGDRIATYENYQLREDMPHWAEDQDKMLHALPILGCLFKKVYYDSEDNINASDLIYPENLVVDNNILSLEKAPRISHEVEIYPHVIIERQRAGLYLKTSVERSTSQLSTGVREDSGDEYSATDEEASHVFIEQHRLLDLDKDGYPEPYIVTIHRDTAEVVRVVTRYNEQGIKRGPDGEVLKINPIHYFIKYEFMPALDGSFYSLGLGELLFPINTAVNSTINQLMDAGHMQNTGGGFIGKGLRMKAGSMSFRPNEWKTVNTIGDDIRRSIVPLPTAQPSPVLFQLLGLLIESGKEISSVKDVLTGEGQGANASPTTTLALIEQGLKVFTAIYQRIHRSLKKELKKLHELNAEHVDEERYKRITGDQEANLSDFNIEDSDVIPVSDPNLVTDLQKASKAQFLLQFIQDERIDGVEIYRRVFESFNIEDIDTLFKKQEPQQPDPALEIALVKQEMEAERLDIERQKSEIAIRKTEYEIKKLETASILDLANAESKEIGNQVGLYKAELDAVTANINNEKTINESNINKEETNVKNTNSGGVQ
jgi:chaperonin GroES